MKISEIYNKLKIHPNLQEHMIWVAGLAKVICDNWNAPEAPLNSEDLFQACLFHDAAKLINFKIFEKDAEYWEKIRSSYIKKFGDNEQKATIALCRLVRVSDNAIELLNAKELYPFVQRARFIMSSGSYELKILGYCDSRISPKGVTSLYGRYEELLKRDNSKSKDRESLKLFFEIEKQIQKNTGVNLTNVNQEMVQAQRDYFLDYEI